MSRPPLEPAAAAALPSRIGSARGRAAAARRGLGMVAVASFGLALLLVRASHPAASTAAGLSAPPSLVAQIQGSPVGGGLIAPASGPPAAATSTS
jgi:hypothetical protein